MEDCLFCKIVAGEIPSNKVYEDDTVYAWRFMTSTRRRPCIFWWSPSGISSLPPR